MAATPQTAAPAACALTERHLRIRRLGIDTYQEPVVFLREDCHVCRSEGFESQSRVELRHGDKRIVATLNVVRAGGLIELAEDEAGLSEVAWRSIGAAERDGVSIGHPAPVESFSHVRAKVFGHEFTAPALEQVIDDIGAGRYSNIEMAAFITACAADRLNTQETVALTQAMVATGSRLSWAQRPIVDKHCVGGLPGNRTTLIIVPIIAALGLKIPKTSSRAITSPAGTADTMETLAPVALDVPSMRRVVEREGGCIVWGGAVALSPADDVLIRVERPLDLDGDAQLVASVMSKKAAAGSTHVVIDVPVGPTAKVRSESAGHALAWQLIEVGRALGLHVDVMLTDGTQPVGCGIGPALEARDVLAVLRNDAAAPADLRERAIMLAGRIVELAQLAPPNSGTALAAQALADGRAWTKFQAIAEAQGGLRVPPTAREHHIVAATQSGDVLGIDNRRLARIAKLAGAPLVPAAGLDLHVKIGSQVEKGQPLYTIHAQSLGELHYALDYAQAQQQVIALGTRP
ncbi:MAG: thymidine phosphorylase family protein [Rudaea sp.]|nr:thymidine phosphorylase family protein [Rudaea sp.]